VPENGTFFLPKFLDVEHLNFSFEKDLYFPAIWVIIRLWLGGEGNFPPIKNRVATNAKPKGKKGTPVANRDFFEAKIVDFLDYKKNAPNKKRAVTPSKTAIANEPIEPEIIDFLTYKMNARNKKRAVAPSKTAIANGPIKLKIVEFLTEKNEQILTSVIGEAVGISTSKATALCKQLAEDGKIAGEEKIVPKIGKRMVWNIVTE
jgi:hypothetical protein